MKKILIVLGILLSVFAASESLQAQQKGICVVSFPDTSTWILNRIGGIKAKQHTGSRVFITVDKADKKMSGYTSCNYIHGQVSIKDTLLSFKELSLGKRECDEATAAMEKELLDMLQKTDSWSIIGNELYLFTKRELILEFKQAEGK